MTKPGDETTTPRGRDGALIGALVVALGVYLLLRNLGMVVPGFSIVLDLLRRVGWPLAIILVGVAMIVGFGRAGFQLPGREARLVRSRSSRIMGGVMGGLADYLSADPTMLRLLYVAAAFLTDLGAALVAYLVCAIVIPLEPAEAAPEGASSGQGPE
jgi:phage shock protein C